jgi:hypothetical protein
MRSRTLVFAALLSTSVAVPALAAIERIGSVDFSRRDTYGSQYADFTGDAVILTARDASLDCDRVTATFANGRTREIFRGMLRRGERVNIDLPGAERTVTRLDFDCRPLDRARGRLDVAADTNNSRYRDFQRDNPFSWFNR